MQSEKQDQIAQSHTRNELRQNLQPHSHADGINFLPDGHGNFYVTAVADQRSSTLNASDIAAVACRRNGADSSADGIARKGDDVLARFGALGRCQHTHVGTRQAAPGLG